MSVAKIKLIGTAYDASKRSHVTFSIDTIDSQFDTSRMNIGISEIHEDGSHAVATIRITKDDFARMANAILELRA